MFFLEYPLVNDKSLDTKVIKTFNDSEYDESNGGSSNHNLNVQVDFQTPNPHLRQSQVQDVTSSKQSLKKSSNINDSVGEVYLPPGYGADKLAILLIKVLEEEVKVSTSHSERRTIHVLQCRGYKNREKPNKVRCRSCEERDKKKNEVQKDKD